MSRWEHGRQVLGVVGGFGVSEERVPVDVTGRGVRGVGGSKATKHLLQMILVVRVVVRLIEGFIEELIASYCFLTLIERRYVGPTK